MTVYFDHINYTNRISPSFDPSNEWFPFLYYKLQDWCTKIGTNKAEVITGVPEWTAATEGWDNVSTTYLQLALYPDDIRDGSRTSTYYTTMTWYQQTTSYFYVNAEKISKTANRNSTYGYLPLTGSASIGSSYRHLYGSNLTRGYQLAVMYGDTPGKEFFAMSDSQRSTTMGFTHVLTKVTPRPGLPAGHGAGWATFTNDDVFVWGTDDQNSNGHPLSGWQHQYASEGAGSLGHRTSSYYPYLYTRPPLVSYSGYWLATADNIAYAHYPRQELSIIQTPDNKQWLHWKNGVHIDVTGEGGLL